MGMEGCNHGLSLLQLSAVQELANIGLGRAATALSELTGTPFNMAVPEVVQTGLEHLPERGGETSFFSAAVYTPVEGEFDGHLAFLFDWESVQALCLALAGDAPESPVAFSEMHASVVMEVGNILNSSFLNAVSDMTGLTMSICPPIASLADPHSILASLAVEAEMRGADALSVDTALESMGPVRLVGSFFLIPGPSGLGTLFRALGLEEAA
jgi:chemotaxis protein CheC